MTDYNNMHQDPILMIKATMVFKECSKRKGRFCPVCYAPWSVEVGLRLQDLGFGFLGLFWLWV